MADLQVVLRQIVQRFPRRHRAHHQDVVEHGAQVWQQTVGPAVAEFTVSDVEVFGRRLEFLNVEGVHLGGAANQVKDNYAIGPASGLDLRIGGGAKGADHRRQGTADDAHRADPAELAAGKAGDGVGFDRHVLVMSRGIGPLHIENKVRAIQQRPQQILGSLVAKPFEQRHRHVFLPSGRESADRRQEQLFYNLVV